MEAHRHCFTRRVLTIVTEDLSTKSIESKIYFLRHFIVSLLESHACVAGLQSIPGKIGHFAKFPDII